MTSAAGVLTKAAFKKGGTWGTAVECGAGDGMLIRPSGFKKTRENVVDNSLGRYFSQTSDIGEIKAEGDIQGYARYETKAFELLVAMAMGACVTTYGTPKLSGTASGNGTTTTLVDAGAFATGCAVGDYVQVTRGSVVYTRKITERTDNQITWVGALPTATEAADAWEINDETARDATKVYTLAESLAGQFITGAIHNGAYIDEATSAKVVGLTIKGQVGQPVEVTFDLVANDRTGGSSVNTTATFANVTFSENAQRVLYRHLVFRMNDQDGDALDSGDVLSPASFELSFKRPCSGVYGLGGNFDTIDEATEDGRPVVDFAIEFARVEDATRFTEWENQTAKKADLTFTWGDYSVVIELPHLKYANVETPMAEGRYNNPCAFNALGCTTAPTGMTALTTPFRITVVNAGGWNLLEAGN